MADTEPTVASSGPPATVVDHNPLPESNWFWRRSYIFALSTVTIIGIWIMVQTMVNLASGKPELVVGAFVKIIGWLLIELWFVVSYYILGASAETVTKWVQTASMLKGGVGWASSSQAVAPDGSSAVVQTKTVGAPPVEPTPAPASTAKTVFGIDLDKVNASPMLKNLPWNRGK
jgi:hypothetical protein